MADGILPAQHLRALAATGALRADPAIREDQIQPASLDLRLGRRAWRVRASFLPGPTGTVADGIDRHAMHEINLTAGAVLERGCVYVAELAERVSLGPTVAGFANPKSSTGRLDVFARLIADRTAEFDRLPAGYAGALHVELAPRTFSILVRSDARLVQLRLREGRPRISDGALRALHERDALVDSDVTIDDGLVFTVDALGRRPGDVVGYRARPHAGLVDVDRTAHYPREDFWEPVMARPGRGIVLNPDDFYILASKETVSVPPDHAAEMLPYDARVGEFRVHYAGFFDPGFGHGSADGGGSRAVLEVRAREVPFVVEDGQAVGRLVYEPLLEKPDKLYGRAIGSTYQAQGLRLGKQFR